MPYNAGPPYADPNMYGGGPMPAYKLQPVAHELQTVARELQTVAHQLQKGVLGAQPPSYDGGYYHDAYGNGVRLYCVIVFQVVMSGCEKYYL